MDIQTLEIELNRIEQDRTLETETALNARTQALKVIHLVEEMQRWRGLEAGFSELWQRAQALKQHLTAANRMLFENTRAWLRTGEYTSLELRRFFDRFTTYTPNQKHALHLGPDGLDLLIKGMLEIDQAPPIVRDISADMISYQETPARALLDLVDHADIQSEDVFYDLGAGLGQVAIVIHLLTGIRTKAVEIEPAYCAFVRQCAKRLGLHGVQVIEADAQEADYADGTLFFLFTPFKGRMLQTVMERLKQEGQKRPIRVISYGPCTLAIAEQTWLKMREPEMNHEFRLAIFDVAPAIPSSQAR